MFRASKQQKTRTASMKSLINWNSFYEKKFIPITLPFLVQFRLNLGLNNLKFVHKSISAVESIGLNRSDRIKSKMTNDVTYMDGRRLYG